jgi:predicted RND superfamily exporter protein
MLEEYADKNSDVRVYVETESSVSMVLGSIIAGDLIGLNIAFVCIVLYAVLVLGNFHPVLSRAAVAFCGVLCVGFAILGTYGIAGYCNVPITPVTSLLPFILVGIGVDDMFVLVGALNRTPKHLDTTTRISLMMRDAGSSITMTSLTDMLAFALGTTTSFPALRYFCIYAAIGIMLDFMFQCSLFVCALVWDEQRQKARGVDCFCCVAPCAKEGEKCACCYVKEEDMGKSCCSGKCCMKEGGYLRGFFANTYAPLLKNAGIKVAVLVLAIAFFAVGIVGITKLKEVVPCPIVLCCAQGSVTGGYVLHRSAHRTSLSATLCPATTLCRRCLTSPTRSTALERLWFRCCLTTVPVTTQFTSISLRRFPRYGSVLEAGCVR